jgi:hypothetical protein
MILPQRLSRIYFCSSGMAEAVPFPKRNLSFREATATRNLQFSLTSLQLQIPSLTLGMTTNKTY